MPAEQKQFFQQLTALKASVMLLETHLKLKNFIVGYQMTLADVVLTTQLVMPMQMLFDQQFRKEQIPNLSRYVSLVLQNKNFVNSFGTIVFCGKKALSPVFGLIVEKREPKKPKAGEEEQKKGGESKKGGADNKK